MSSYSIPAMSHTNEFTNLDYLGKYVDHLLETTGDAHYATVYEWGDHGPGPYPPLAVYFRVQGEWVRRGVLVTIRQKKDGSCEFAWELKPVNGH